MHPNRRPKVPSGLSRNHNSEKVVSQNLLGDFIADGSRGEAIIEKIFGCPIQKISLNGLVQVASLISLIANVQFSRNFKRRKDLVVKWFQDNENNINVYLQFLRIIYNDGKEAINSNISV